MSSALSASRIAQNLRERSFLYRIARHGQAAETRSAPILPPPRPSRVVRTLPERQPGCAAPRVQPTQGDQQRGPVGDDLEVHADDSGHLPLTVAPHACGTGGAFCVVPETDSLLTVCHFIARPGAARSPPAIAPPSPRATGAAGRARRCQDRATAPRSSACCGEAGRKGRHVANVACALHEKKRGTVAVEEGGVEAP